MAADNQNIKIIRRGQGQIMSTKMQETAIVTVVTHKVHAKYKKNYKVTKKMACHNPKNKYKVGDVIIFEECRPLSKTKRWRIIKKVK
ncbi:MAG: 30S ribosomal protein S17 [Candidatus Komeilibacteria bacterium]